MEHLLAIYDFDFFKRNFMYAEFQEEEEEQPIQKLPALRAGKIQSEQILVPRRAGEILRIIEGVFTKVVYFKNKEGQTKLKAKLVADEQIKMKLKLAEIGPATLITIKKIEGETALFNQVFLALSEALAVL